MLAWQRYFYSIEIIYERTALRHGNGPLDPLYYAKLWMRALEGVLDKKDGG